MKNTKLIQFAQAFMLVPVLSMSSAIAVQSAPVADNAVIVQADTVSPQTALLQKLNITNGVFTDNTDEKEAQAKLDQDRLAKAEAIDAYFDKYDMPLSGTGMKMVLEAEKNNIDWRLLPAIAVRESTGGKNACKKVSNSFFGWGSCKISFKSKEEAIEVVAKNLGGNNPNTDYHYAGKTTKEILQKYNPPSVVKRYAEQVMDIMDTIGEADTATGSNITT